MNAFPLPSADKTLRRLFLALFLRGRSSRGIEKGTTPKSIGTKLGLTLTFYFLFGLIALTFLKQPIYALSIYLHAMTFFFVGALVAASAGEMLFNKEEAEILLHRPVTSRQLLRAKVGVMVRVSLWLAFAFNAIGLVATLWSPGIGRWFPLVHAVSLSLEAIFCSAFVVVVYQLCLRWFGRERLDGVMTTAQVFVAVGAMLAGQLLPRMGLLAGRNGGFRFDSWWISLLPPAWFAGMDDAIVGSQAAGSWALAAVGLVATVAVVVLAFGVLAREFDAGLQRIGETISKPRMRSGGRRLLDRLVDLPVLRWWLREPVTRASFLLTAAYLTRDRDVKLRVYPGLAPILVMPLIMMMPGFGRRGGTGPETRFGIAFAGAFIALIPFMAMGLLRFSQQWQASDVFRAAPLSGPGPLCHGARKAALLFLGVPLVMGVASLSWLMLHDLSRLELLLPGVIAMPAFSLIPCLGGNAVPLSMPTEEAKSASRGVTMIGMMMLSMLLSGVAIAAQSFGVFWWMILIESGLVAVSCFLLQAAIANSSWGSIE